MRRSKRKEDGKENEEVVKNERGSRYYFLILIVLICQPVLAKPEAGEENKWRK